MTYPIPMAESMAGKCAYGDRAIAAFPGAVVLWEAVDGDYQGSAALIFRLPSGRLGFYEWSWGSCESCDDWTARGLSGREIEEEMAGRTAWFGSPERLLGWVERTEAGGSLMRPSRGDIEAILLEPYERAVPIR